MLENSEYRGEFIAESQEHLLQAEESLLHLAMDAGNQDAVQSCFCSLHTIKGGARFLGLERIQALAHAAEQLLDNIRTGSVVCGPQPADALLQALTRLDQLITGLASGANVDGDEQAWIESLQKPAPVLVGETNDYPLLSDAIDPRHPVPATSRRIKKSAGPISGELVLEAMFTRLIALERRDIPGLLWR